MDGLIDHVFKALADPSRRLLLDRLRESDGQTLSELCEHVSMARQSVSKHLDILESANLLAVKWHGREKLHFLNPVPIHEIADRWIRAFEHDRLRVLSDLKRELEGEDVPGTAFVYVTYIRTTVEALWSALLEPDFTRRYWYATHHQSDWETGAPWRLMIPDGRVAYSGRVLEIEPERRLVLSWRAEFREAWQAEGDTRVAFDLKPHGDHVKLTVTHECDRPDSTLVRTLSQGWPKILSSLKSLLETGEPMQVTSRWPEGM